jgi:hypothetical protein
MIRAVNPGAVALCAFIAAASLLNIECGKSGSDVEVDVLDFQQPAASDAEQPADPGHVWAALRVEM